MDATRGGEVGWHGGGEHREDGESAAWGVGCEERGARVKLDEHAGAVIAFSPGPSKESGEGLGGKKAYAAVGDVVSRDMEFEGAPRPVLDLPADHSFARYLVLLAKAGDLKAAGLISDEVGALGGDKKRRHRSR